MNREDIIAMAREATRRDDWWDDDQALERFAALVAAAEREACAKVCDDYPHGAGLTEKQLAQIIRARSNT